MAKRTPKLIIGWEEWVAFPDLNLPAVKAKIDTGAKTSALHATNITPFTQQGQEFVRFEIHPLQKNSTLVRTCEAPLVDHRFVTSSNGRKEKRYVIKTRFVLGDRNFLSEVTLTSRDKMNFRMLLGKEALIKGHLVIDPSKKFVMGKNPDAKSLYLCEE